MKTIIKNNGLTASVVEKWSGNLELTVNGTPVIVGVEYEDGRYEMRVDFIRFIDSATTEDGDDLVWDREEEFPWASRSVSEEQRAVLAAVLTLSSIDLDELTVEGGRPLLWY